MNRDKIEAIEKALADAQSRVAEFKAQLVEAEKAGDSCSEWLLRECGDVCLHGTGYAGDSAVVDISRYSKRGRAFDTEEQAKQLDDNQILYMRIVRAIAAENKKVGYVVVFDGVQINRTITLHTDGIITGYWTRIQTNPTHCYMHESVIPKILEQFSDEELTTFITKGMLL